MTLAIDSTGSMHGAIAWVKADAIKLLRALALISREPRLGVTFYRDKGDAYVVQVHPMTDDGGKPSPDKYDWQNGDLLLSNM